MTRVLDEGEGEVIQDAVLDVIADLGYTMEESIPGLVKAIITIANDFPDPIAVLDEVVDLICDGQEAAGKRPPLA